MVAVVPDVTGASVITIARGSVVDPDVYRTVVDCPATVTLEIALEPVSRDPMTTRMYRSEDAVPIPIEVNEGVVRSALSKSAEQYTDVRGPADLGASIPNVKGIASRCFENSMFSDLMIAGAGGRISPAFACIGSIKPAARVPASRAFLIM
jgi:hypothetical protein